MAKRRNLKKEKASRNQAYARQFRKKSFSSFSRKKNFSDSRDSDKGDKESEAKDSGDE